MIKKTGMGRNVESALFIRVALGICVETYYVWRGVHYALCILYVLFSLNVRSISKHALHKPPTYVWRGVHYAI